MKEHRIRIQPDQNKENDFIDTAVGAIVFGGLLFLVFVGVTVAELVLGY